MYPGHRSPPEDAVEDLKEQYNCGLIGEEDVGSFKFYLTLCFRPRNVQHILFSDLAGRMS